MRHRKAIACYRPEENTWAKKREISGGSGELVKKKPEQIIRLRLFHGGGTKKKSAKKRSEGDAKRKRQKMRATKQKKPK